MTLSIAILLSLVSSTNSIKINLERNLNMFVESLLPKFEIPECVEKAVSSLKKKKSRVGPYFGGQIGGKKEKSERRKVSETKGRFTSRRSFKKVDYKVRTERIRVVSGDRFRVSLKVGDFPEWFPVFADPNIVRISFTDSDPSKGEFVFTSVGTGTGKIVFSNPFKAESVVFNVSVEYKERGKTKKRSEIYEISGESEKTEARTNLQEKVEVIGKVSGNEVFKEVSNAVESFVDTIDKEGLKAVQSRLKGGNQVYSIAGRMGIDIIEGNFQPLKSRLNETLKAVSPEDRARILAFAVLLCVRKKISPDRGFLDVVDSWRGKFPFPKGIFEYYLALCYEKVKAFFKAYELFSEAELSLEDEGLKRKARAKATFIKDNILDYR